MPNHKLTALGRPALTTIQLLLQQYRDLFGSPRRLAYADGVVAISGLGGDVLDGLTFARNRYGLDLQASGGLAGRFAAMAGGYGFVKVEKWDAHACSEAHLWMTLAGLHARSAGDGQTPRHLHPHPRHLHAWVYEIDGKNRPKEDSPCRNCRQWVRREFRTVNGTS